MAKKKQAQNERLSVRDADGKLRALFGQIADRIGQAGVAEGVRYAATFTDGATRQAVNVIDYVSCTLDELRTLAVHGYDFRVRAAALAEIEERKKQTLRAACNEVEDDVTRLSWLQSLINEARKHAEVLSDGDPDAAWTCCREVQALHDALAELIK